VCGFAWDATDPAEVADGVRTATSATADLLVDHGARALERYAPERWSPVGYGCHVRDVLYNLRDRIVLALVEDNPTPHPLFGTPRVDLGLYGRDTPAVTARTWCPPATCSPGHSSACRTAPVGARCSTAGRGRPSAPSTGSPPRRSTSAATIWTTSGPISGKTGRSAGRRPGASGAPGAAILR